MASSLINTHGPLNTQLVCLILSADLWGFSPFPARLIVTEVQLTFAHTALACRQCPHHVTLLPQRQQVTLLQCQHADMEHHAMVSQGEIWCKAAMPGKAAYTDYYRFVTALWTPHSTWKKIILAHMSLYFKQATWQRRAALCPGTPCFSSLTPACHWCLQTSN